MSSLTRRSFVTGSVAAAMAWALQSPARAAATDVYRRAIVIDGLGGLGNSGTDGPLTGAQVQDVRNSGLTCVHLTMRPVGTTPPDEAFTQAVINIGQMESEIDSHPGVLARIRSVADIRAAKEAGRTGLIYGFQDGVAFETDLSRLDELYRLGLRIVQPTYNRRNLLGDGCLEPANAGLSLAGVQYVLRLETEVERLPARVAELESGTQQAQARTPQPVSMSLELIHVPRAPRGPRWRNS